MYHLLEDACRHLYYFCSRKIFSFIIFKKKKKGKQEFWARDDATKVSPPFWGQSAGGDRWLRRKGSSTLERCQSKGGAGCTFRRIVLDPEAELHPAPCISRRKDVLCACVLCRFPLHPCLSSCSPAPSPFYPLSLILPFSLSLLFCSFSPSLTRLFQYSIFIIRFQQHVSFIVWHLRSDRRTILFPVLSSFLSLRRRVFCLERSMLFFGGILVSKRLCVEL